MKKQLILLGTGVLVIVGFLFIRSQTSHQVTTQGTLFDVHTEPTESVFEETVITEVDDLRRMSDEAFMFVDVGGQVANPGIFQVSGDVRVGHVIELAGGLLETANTRGINQAARVFDEMIIFVPHIDDEVDIQAEIMVGQVPTPMTDDDGRISLSTATAQQLQTLTGIGPVLSANIIAHRETFGPFTTIDELLQVNGVGARILENIRDDIRP